MEYLPIFILLVVGLFLGVVIMGLSYILGPKLPNKRKDLPFECGVPGVGQSQHRISVRFYLVAILFLLFDVEAIFFYPWAIVFKKYLELNTFILFEMGVFVGILLLGYYYVLKKGALEWE